MSILKTLRSLILGILLHFLLIPLGMIACMGMFGKQADEIYIIRCTPGIALSCLGACFGFQKRTDPTPKNKSTLANG